MADVKNQTPQATSGIQDPAMATYIRNLEAKTGKTVAELGDAGRATGIEKHADLLKFFQQEYDLSYGYANFAAHTARGTLERGSEDDAVAAQYAGAKAALRPIYEALSAAVREFGDDVEFAPKKDYVSLRRTKQFGCIQPSTSTRVDVGLNLKGEPHEGRLEKSANSMFTHRIRVSDTGEVDAEVLSWLRKAYDRA